MSRLVLIADSETGRLVDVFGAPRESGRYARFAKRMLSADLNPVLDYGANGGDKLEISAGGTNGAEVDILADVVNIPGELKVSGRTVEEMASEGVEYVLDRIVGTPGEVDVGLTTESSSGETLVQVSLDPAVKSRLSLQQAKIVAVGLLKGEGDGVVSEATVDPAPAIGSSNPVQSGGVYSELSGKADSASVAPEYETSSAYEVGSAVMRYGRRYKCISAIAQGGEAWTAEHWEEENVETALGGKVPTVGNTTVYASGNTSGPYCEIRPTLGGINGRDGDGNTFSLAPTGVKVGQGGRVYWPTAGTDIAYRYNLESVSNSELKDSTINVASGGGTFTFPARNYDNARDFVLVIDSRSAQEAPVVVFDAPNCTFVSDDDSVFTASSGVVNVWYCTEISSYTFAVAHKEFAEVTQPSNELQQGAVT